ncbi:MAG: hypothetical protein JWM75_2580 [Sphingomonas bacterium]|nr:hypothetical protein [Sphingomonas bacterium]
MVGAGGMMILAALTIEHRVDLVPQRSRDKRLLLPLVAVALVGDLANVHPVVQQVGTRTLGEGTLALAAALAV